MPTRRSQRLSTRGKTRSGLSVADVRKLVLAMPDTEERPSYGTPGFRVRDKLFTRMLESGDLVVKVDLAWREAIVAGQPDVFYVTPHYLGYPWVIVRLGVISEARLRDVLAEALRLAAPERLAPKAAVRSRRAR